MDRTNAFCCPARGLSVKSCAATTNFLAVEQRFLALDGIYDFKYTDFFRLLGQAISAFRSFPCNYKASSLQFREYLRQKTWRNALQISEIPAAERLFRSSHQPQQTMQPVFHTDRYMCHNADYNCPRYLWQASGVVACGRDSGNAVSREDDRNPRTDGGLTFHVYVATGRLNEAFCGGKSVTANA
jgi:hypothetical protein